MHQPSLPREGGAVYQNLRINRLHAALQAVTANMLAPFIAILALRFGATNLQLGALNALPNLLTFFFTLPIIGSLAGRRRHGPVLVRTYLASRLTLLAVAAVPLVAPRWTVWALVLVWALHNFPFNAANSVTQGYLADVLPPEEVGNALSQRGLVATAAATVTLLLLGPVLDRLPFPGGYQVVAVIACAVGLAEVYAFSRFVEPERAEGPRPVPVSRWQSLRDGARAVRSQGRFVDFLLTAMFFNFSWQMVWPMFSRFQVDVLGANNFWFAVIQVTGSLGGIATYQWWSRRTQQTHPARMMILATLSLAVAPVASLIAPNMTFVAVTQVIVGVGIAGATLVPLHASLYYSPPAERSLYLAVYQTGMMAAASVAPFCGGWLIDLIGPGAALAAGTGIRVIAAGLWWRLSRRDPPLSGMDADGKIRQAL